MKPIFTPIAISIVMTAATLLFSTAWPSRPIGAQTPSPSTYEYATIRWAGRDNTHIIRPVGKVEFIGNELKKLPRPDRCDDRSFYLNLAINGMAKEGYEVVTASNDDVVMRRSIAR
jgi:hypothetical protein